MCHVLKENAYVIKTIPVPRDKYVAKAHAVRPVNSVTLAYVPIAKLMTNAVAIANVAMVFVVPKGPPVVIINVVIRNV